MIVTVISADGPTLPIKLPESAALCFDCPIYHLVFHVVVFIYRPQVLLELGPLINSVCMKVLALGGAFGKDLWTFGVPFGKCLL